jgi:hypothetical protein
MKIDSKLMQEFYYGENLSKAISAITGAQYTDFLGMGYNDKDPNNIKDIELTTEIEFEDDSKIELEVTGEVKDNMIIFNNSYNNKCIIYKLDTQKYIY